MMKWKGDAEHVKNIDSLRTTIFMAKSENFTNPYPNPALILTLTLNFSEK